MPDSESDVSKALAAFGAPPLKYRSFTHAPIKSAPLTELDALPPATPAPVAAVSPPVSIVSPAPSMAVPVAAPPAAQIAPQTGVFRTDASPAAAVPPPPPGGPTLRPAPLPGSVAAVPPLPAVTMPPVEAGGPRDMLLTDMFRILGAAA